MTDNLSDAPVVNHDEALQLATLNQVGSNLARCYLELRERCERQQNALTDVLKECDMSVRLSYALQRRIKAIVQPDSQLPGHSKA